MSQRVPKVSVVLPVYNGENYLQEAIDSVLAQTFTDFEFVIVDNASTDNTPNILEKYKNDKRFVCIRNTSTVSMAANFNISVLHAQGMYIKPLCHDDILKPNYLEKFVSVLDARKSVALVTSFDEFFGMSQGIKGEREFPRTGEIKGTEAVKNMLETRNWVGGPSAVMFRRSLLWVGLFNPALTGSLDWDFWLRLLSFGNVYVIPEPLFSSRIHEKQGTRDCKKELVFEKDKIRILDLAFKFPYVYGEYTRKEKRTILSKATNRLAYRLVVNILYGKNYSAVRHAYSFVSSYKLGIAHFSCLVIINFIRFCVEVISRKLRRVTS